MLGSTVRVVVDRPLGSAHPHHPDIVYPVNYGYVPGVLAGDGDEQDAYILGVGEPVAEFTGRVIAIVHRFDDVEEKWVVAPEGLRFTKEEIEARVAFQEQYFRTELRMAPDFPEIRPARLEDLPGIRAYDRHIPAARLEECVRSGRVEVLCGGGKILGVLRYSLFWQTIPFLDLIFLDEGYRGQGWGSRWMAHWEQVCAGLGYDHVMLSTQADETARFFYEKLGYRSIGAFLPPEQEAEELMYLKELKK